MTSLYLSMVEAFEASAKASIRSADEGRKHGLYLRLLANEAWLRLWFPWL